MAKATNRRKRGNRSKEADWGHFTRLLKILAIIFIAFSSFHWIVIQYVQKKPVHVLNKIIPWPTESENIYFVEEGDTLWDIAFQQYPARDPQDVIDKIRKINRLSSDTIQAGQSLKLP